METNEIIHHLPHRYPFILVDRVLDYEVNKSLTAIKNITMNSPHLQGHFPEMPVMPGVLILEALAQAACILYSVTTKDRDPDAIYFLAGIEKARFKRVVVPGDQLKLHVVDDKRRSKLWQVKAEATVDGETACTATMMAVIGKRSDT